MFNKGYNAVMKTQHKGVWYTEVNMRSGSMNKPVFNALAAFWPGLQTMIGHTSEAGDTLDAYFKVWRKYGATPEGYDYIKDDVIDGQEGYPLRPESAESAWYLYKETKEERWQKAGLDMITNLENASKVECGYAVIADVRTLETKDQMDSYFLAETLKYLYLLFDPENWILKHFGAFVFSTEGHLLPLEYHATGTYSGEALHSTDRIKRLGFPFPRALKRLDFGDPKESIQKFLSFVQTSLSKVSQKTMQSNTKDGRIVFRFNNPIESYRHHLKTGELMVPIGYGPEAFEIVSYLYLGEDEDLLEHLMQGVSLGLETAQRAPLLELLKQNQITIVSDVPVDPKRWNAELAVAPWIIDKATTGERENLESVAGMYGDFGDGVKVQAPLVLGEPLTGCTTLAGTHGKSVKGKVVLLLRGACSFVVKVHMAQLAGAKAVIIYSHSEESKPLNMGSDPDHAVEESAIQIPSTMVSHATGLRLRESIADYSDSHRVTGQNMQIVTMKLSPVAAQREDL